MNELGASHRDALQSTTGREGTDLPLTTVLAPSGSAESNTKAFPTPGDIAASSPEFLRKKVRVGYRAPAIHQLAARVALGTFDLEALKTSDLPTLELRKELLKISGVGP